MSSLFICNNTKQNHEFLWRIGEMHNPARRMIQAGQQIMIPDLTTDNINSIISQHRVYGLQDANELSRRRAFAGLCYSIDKPVNTDSMLATYDLNDQQLQKSADDRRTVTAAAISDNIAKQLQDATGIEKEKLRPRSVQVEIVEETEGKPAVASGTEVPADPRHGQLKRAMR